MASETESEPGEFRRQFVRTTAFDYPGHTEPELLDSVDPSSVPSLDIWDHLDPGPKEYDEPPCIEDSYQR